MTIFKTLFLQLVTLAITIQAQGHILTSRIIPFIPRPLVVASGSMTPTYQLGDVLLVQKQASYQVNQVVSYYPPDEPQRLVTHRIVNVDQTTPDRPQFQLQGDANQTPDFESVPLNNILGVVIGRVPWLGYLHLALQTPLGVIFLGVVPITILVYEELRTVSGYFSTSSRQHD